MMRDIAVGLMQSSVITINVTILNSQKKCLVAVITRRLLAYIFAIKQP